MPDYSQARETYEVKRKRRGRDHLQQPKEFQDRMDDRERHIEEREKRGHEQYVNPMYFGHKKPPKKRPAHKMKLCKVCGIRH
jgi:hypothetical protein